MVTRAGSRAASVEQSLKELGIRLPSPPEPFGIYAKTVQTGNLPFSDWHAPDGRPHAEIHWARRAFTVLMEGAGRWYGSWLAKIMKGRITMQATIKSQAGHVAGKQLFNAAGVLLQFLASPDEVGDAICLVRGTMPPGVEVPLHSHAEPEILYVLDGSLQVCRSTEGANGWTNASVGDVVIIPGGEKHALRNASSLPATLVLVTKSQLYEFFRELAKPFDPNQPPSAATPEAMQQLFEVAAKYGYWLASPAENAAIGLNRV